MNSGILLPKANSNSLKNIIVSILSEVSSLSAKEIHLRVKKEKNVSYQAVFKMLKELLESNILEKQQSKYFISEKWINELKQFVKNFDKKENKKGFDPTAQTQTLELNTLFEFFGGMLDLFSSDILYNGCDHRFGGGLMRHMWWALSFDDTGLKKFKHMLGPKNSYVVVMKNTPVDRWLEAYYQKAGATGIKLGTNYTLEEDIAIVGDYVIQVFFEEKTKKKLDKLYSEVKDITDAIQKGILEQILAEPTKVKVVITKNKDLADIYLKKLLSFFGDPDEILSNPEHTATTTKEIEEEFRKSSF
ncbi:MAG: hypothetical protein HON47_00390 [Candidatus Diapherotrites archaeon]|jgi:hypothetical protein|uniref:Uncharacterized protein n=1 Tax=Candidatus Iainarchaeum sp. TaxID=3101447 RepID=A0A8T5GE47_9ARCH|nr:hypothetical protein [Candidatus Diapherotrites archaeon]